MMKYNPLSLIFCITSEPCKGSKHDNMEYYHKTKICHQSTLRAGQRSNAENKERKHTGIQQRERISVSLLPFLTL